MRNISIKILGIYTLHTPYRGKGFQGVSNVIPLPLPLHTPALYPWGFPYPCHSLTFCRNIDVQYANKPHNRADLSKTEVIDKPKIITGSLLFGCEKCHVGKKINKIRSVQTIMQNPDVQIRTISSIPILSIRHYPQSI